MFTACRNICVQSSDFMPGIARLFCNRAESVFFLTLCYAGVGISYGLMPVSVHTSVTSQYCIETIVWIELVFGIQALLNLF